MLSIIKKGELKEDQKRVNPAKTNIIQRLIEISNNLTLNKFKTLTSSSKCQNKFSNRRYKSLKGASHQENTKIKKK